ncbi:MAG: nitroreductase family protein [Methanotrichaceae archaeon]|nr:nitroreductase family protein [Methanotrichaceae archaeon]
MIDILRKRRSIRIYKEKEIDPDTIDKLKEAALRSPSSRGINPWRFFFVADKAKLARLSEAKEHGSAFLKDAGLGVVVCADERQSDVWIEDCSIASIIMQLAGQEVGLGSCWVQIRNRLHKDGQTSEDYVRNILDLPGNVRVESIISFGYPDEKKPPVPKEQLEFDKIVCVD